MRSVERSPEHANPSVVDRYFRTAPSPSLDEIRDAVWNDAGPAGAPAAAVAATGALVEQYRLYVEMADRISARRGVANTFFLSLNTAVFSLGATLWRGAEEAPVLVLALLWAVLVMECLAWFWLLRSYRQLNSAKYAVIGALEERLPSSPYWRGEWVALGQGRDVTRYWPLSHVEQWLPMLFAVSYSLALFSAMR